MHDRRAFLQSSMMGFAGLAGASGLWLGGARLGQAADKKASGRPDTLFLTWRRDPTTTMLVQWIGPKLDDESCQVHYAPHGLESWRGVSPASKPYPLTDLHVYRVELTDLAPGSEYQFRIGTTGAIQRFRTMPAKATSTFQFVSGGDCGVGSAAVASNILAAKQDPMFALIGGDLGYDNGRSADVSLKFMRNYSQHMVDSQGRLIPLVVCIGNHEVNGGYKAKRKDGPFFFALHDALFDEQTYATLDFGDYLSLVLLDTGHIAKFEGAQADWLDSALRERTDRPHLIVANHRPAYPAHRKPTDGEPQHRHWVPLFQKHNVDLVLEHHDHLFKRTYPLTDGLKHKNGLVFLGDGSWGRLRPPVEPEKRPYLAVCNEAYHITLHRIEGAQRFHMALSDGGKVVDVCTTTKRPIRAMGRGA